MAISHSNLLSHKSVSVVLAIFITLFLSVARKVNSAESLSFNITRFDPNFSSIVRNITIRANVKLIRGAIILPSTNFPGVWDSGRFFFTIPVRIWDHTTGNVASFVTSFTFMARDAKGFSPSGGMIFFLAPNGTEIPSNSGGGKLGILDGNNGFNQFVGVEFDSYSDEWDPDYPHIGIDVTSLTSLKTVKWNRVSGSLVKVDIIYDSLSKTLSVAVTNENGLISTVSQVVDLKAVLSEVVYLGFSGTSNYSGVDWTQHEFYSWSFTSTLETSTVSENIDIASYA